MKEQDQEFIFEELKEEVSAPTHTKQINSLKDMITKRFIDIALSHFRDGYAEEKDTIMEEPKGEIIPYLFWVDPDLKLFYRLNLNTFEKNYEVIEKELMKEFREKIKFGLDTIKSIRKNVMIIYRKWRR